MTPAPLLDTHIWVWWMHGDPRLSPAIIEELDNLPADGRPVISDISLWEVAMLVSLGRLHLNKTLESWFAVATDRKTVKVWPITSRIAAEVARLPESFHRDPADRLIVATSRVLGTPLITHDDRIISSGLTRRWRTPSKPRSASFDERLPRLFELMGAVADVENEHSYFREFEKSLALPTGKLDAMAKLESQLSVLDQRSWHDLRLRAAAHAIAPRRGEGRGWQEMFDVFSEARAYGYLHAIGASNIRFIPRTTRRTPDLEAMTIESPLLCEVKTINISDDQAAKNAQRSQGAITVANAQTAVKDGLLAKVSEAVSDALKQLSSHDPQKKSRWMVFVALNFDDFLNEFIDRYIRQIDEYLATHPCAEAELIFAPRSNPFGRALTMQSAAVYLD